MFEGLGEFAHEMGKGGTLYMLATIGKSVLWESGGWIRGMISMRCAALNGGMIESGSDEKLPTTARSSRGGLVSGSRRVMHQGL